MISERLDDDSSKACLFCATFSVIDPTPRRRIWAAVVFVLTFAAAGHVDVVIANAPAGSGACLIDAALTHVGWIARILGDGGAAQRTRLH